MFSSPENTYYKSVQDSVLKWSLKQLNIASHGVLAFNASTWGGRGMSKWISEFEASLILQSEFQDSQQYTEKHRLEKQNKIWHHKSI